MAKSPKEYYVVPGWMEKYFPMFNNTGGNNVIDLLHDNDTSMFSNCVRYAFIVSARSQWGMLMQMKENGLIEKDSDHENGI